MKRAVTAGLWFFAAFCVHELAWSIAGSPRVLGLVFGAAAAAFVLIDPLHLLAPASAAARKPINQIRRAQPVGR
jgi:hypothetical protein